MVNTNMLGAGAPPLDPATAPGSHGVLHLLQNQPELTVVGTAVYAAIRKFFVLNSPTVTNQRVPTVPVLGRWRVPEPMDRRPLKKWVWPRLPISSRDELERQVVKVL
jgi:hypothetical protein